MPDKKKRMNGKRQRDMRLAKEGFNREHKAAATIAKYWRENFQHRTLEALIRRFDAFQVSVDVLDRLGPEATTHAIHHKDFTRAAFRLLQRINWTINALELSGNPSHIGIVQVTPQCTKLFLRAILFAGHLDAPSSRLALDSRSAIECFFRILDALRHRGFALHKVDRRLRKGFTPAFIKYYNTFLNWHVPEGTALANRIIAALRDLYYAKCKVHRRLHKALMSECNLQIRKLRMKFKELNVPALSLDSVDAEVRKMRPVWEAEFAGEKAVETIGHYWKRHFKHNTLWLQVHRARQLNITLEGTKNMSTDDLSLLIEKDEVIDTMHNLIFRLLYKTSSRIGETMAYLPENKWMAQKTLFMFVIHHNKRTGILAFASKKITQAMNQATKKMLCIWTDITELVYTTKDPNSIAVRYAKKEFRDTFMEFIRASDDWTEEHNLRSRQRSGKSACIEQLLVIHPRVSPDSTDDVWREFRFKINKTHALIYSLRNKEHISDTPVMEEEDVKPRDYRWAKIHENVVPSGQDDPGFLERNYLAKILMGRRDFDYKSEEYILTPGKFTTIFDLGKTFPQFRGCTVVWRVFHGLYAMALVRTRFAPYIVFTEGASSGCRVHLGVANKTVRITAEPTTTRKRHRLCIAIVEIKVCALCGKNAQRKCDVCWKKCGTCVRYCSRDCFRADLKTHRHVCGRDFSEEGGGDDE